MTVKELYANISGIADPILVDITESYTAVSASCTITCASTSLNIGDPITVDLGYVGESGRVFTGYVNQINKSAPNGLVEVVCFDELVKANDYFLASEDPENPFSRQNIDATDLVRDLLAEANITNFSGNQSNFIFTAPEFNLISVANAVKQIEGIIAWKTWADHNGVVHFADRKPYITGSDTPTHSFTTGASGNILVTKYEKSDDEIRNKVVVYGSEGVYASASASSPYLPTGFYKTAVIASPLITSNSQAQDSADFNLTLYNRLTESVDVEILGDYTLHVNTIVSITELHTGVSGNWFVYKVNHAWGENGYTIRATLRR